MRRPAECLAVFGHDNEIDAFFLSFVPFCSLWQFSQTRNFKITTKVMSTANSNDNQATLNLVIRRRDIGVARFDRLSGSLGNGLGICGGYVWFSHTELRRLLDHRILRLIRFGSRTARPATFGTAITGSAGSGTTAESTSKPTALATSKTTTKSALTTSETAAKSAFKPTSESAFARSRTTRRRSECARTTAESRTAEVSAFESRPTSIRVGRFAIVESAATAVGKTSRTTTKVWPSCMCRPALRLGMTKLFNLTPELMNFVLQFVE
jgi:hypothetical protein